MTTISLDTPVEQLIRTYPEAIAYGIMNGVRFIFCAGEYPTSLGDLLKIKKVDDPQKFVDGLNDYLASVKSEDNLD